MVEAHDTAATLFRDAAAVGDADIAAFAEKTLTTIHRHQQLAAELPAKRPPTRPQADLKANPTQPDPTDTAR
jgi:hypothetical protein